LFYTEFFIPVALFNGLDSFMLKKTLLLLGLILLLFIGLMAFAPRFLAGNALKQLPHYPWLSQHKIDHIDHGWQKTQIQSQWQSPENSRFLPPAKNYHIKSTLQHAWLPFTPLSLDITVSDPKQTVLTHQLSLAINGIGNGQLTLKQYQSDLLQLTDFQIKSQFQWQPNHWFKPTQLLLPTLNATLSNQHGIIPNAQWQMLSAKVNLQQKTQKDWQMLPSDAQLKQLNWTYQQHQQAVNWQLMDSQWQLQGEWENQLLSAQLQTQTQMSLQPHQVHGQAKADLTIKRLNYQDLIQLIEHYQAIKPTAAKWVRALTLAAYVPPLLKENPLIQLDNLQWHTEQGDVSAKAKVDTQTCGQPHKELNLSFWYQCVDAEIDFKIAQPLLAKLTQSADTTAWLKQQLPGYLHNSVHLSGNVYQFYFKIQQGVISYAP
jgi:hypothetical protein